MDLIQHTAAWAKGDLLQGRIMFVTGIILLIALVAIIRGQNEFLRGMIIPLSLLLLLLLGYGGFLAFTRQTHLENVEKVYSENPEAAVQKEYEKATKDNGAYSMMKPIWIYLIIVAAVLYFFLTKMYFKGLMVGLIGMFLAVLIIDTLLHERLSPYFKVLTESVKSSNSVE